MPGEAGSSVRRVAGLPIRLPWFYPPGIANLPGAVFWQSLPLLVLAVFVTLGWLWPLVGGIALWTLAGLCLGTFAVGIWLQFRRH
jgi:hypothetical protein